MSNKARTGRHFALRGYLTATLTLALGLTHLCSTTIAAPCGSFEEVPLPDPDTANEAVSQLAALSDGTAWAIGSVEETAPAPSLLYFDGNTWTAFPLPEEAEGMAFGASCSTPDGDVWLSGTRPYSVYEVEVILIRTRDGAIDRIDHVFHPRAPIAMSATSDSDVWALTSEGDVIHFDGSSWTEMDVPELFLLHNYAKGIYAAGPDDVWTIGYGGDARGDYFGYVQHWDGSSWTEVPTPFQQQDLTFFRSIDGCAPDDLWLVGYINYSQTIALRWDGGSWSQFAVPASAPLLDVAVLAPDEAWATPYSSSNKDVLYHWDGNSWNEVLPLEPPEGTPVQWGANLSKAGPCDLWTSGSYVSDPNSRMVLARLQPGSTTDVIPVDLTGAGSIAAQPNPLLSDTTLRFELPAESRVTVSIHDATGRVVATLVDEKLGSGEHSILWDGNDMDSNPVARGVFFARIAVDGRSAVSKLAVVR